MNLGGNGAEKGREPLQAAAPKELAGVGLAHRDGQRGHQQGVPSPQEKTSAGSSLASVFLSVYVSNIALFYKVNSTCCLVNLLSLGFPRP